MVASNQKDQFQPLTAPGETVKWLNHMVEARIDPMGMFTPLMHAQIAWLSHPLELADRLAALTSKLWELEAHSGRRMLGIQSKDVEKPHPDDTRFADAIWTDSATWDITKEWYLTFAHHIQDMLYDTPGLTSKDRRRAAFWWRKWLNAVAPTNFLATNPVALQLAVETDGESLRKGFQNFLDDVKAGTVRMSSTEDFKVGENLATTPGKVVFRNNLVEVIHYTPSKEKVHAQPLVIITPWINKFYVLDLNPRKSMVKYLVDQGYDVYITSWKNPGSEMRDVAFDDYIRDGIDQVVQCARNLSGAKQVNAAGYCIGGASLATYMAWANRHYPADQMPVASATFFTTLVDYHHPGDIEVFLDESTVEWLEEQMAQKGYLDGSQMAAAFRLLRSNSLIWHYVVRGYLYGESPSSFDVLYWNMDTTRMPAAMHSWYLREFYLKNRLIQKDALTVAGEPIDLERIVQPVYVVAAVDDHIAPWHQAFRLVNFVAGSKRFVLSSSGHILGIVNPPVKPPKREFWVAEAEHNDSAETWRKRAEERQGSWWEDWLAWLEPHAGQLRNAPPVTTRKFPALADAPGTYVVEP